MTLRGTLRYRDLGAGAWILEDESGAVHDLDIGRISSARLRTLKDQSVEVQGAPGGFGFGMAGSTSWVVDAITLTR